MLASSSCFPRGWHGSIYCMLIFTALSFIFGSFGDFVQRVYQRTSEGRRIFFASSTLNLGCTETKLNKTVSPRQFKYVWIRRSWRWGSAKGAQSHDPGDQSYFRVLEECESGDTCYNSRIIVDHQYWLRF
jgi:hypothetical protein